MTAEEMFELYTNGGAQAVRDYLARLCGDCLRHAVSDFIVAVMPNPECCIDVAVEALRRHAEAVMQDEFGDLPT